MTEPEEELRKNKEKLEHAIGDLLLAFQKENQVEINSLSISGGVWMPNESEPGTLQYNVTVELSTKAALLKKIRGS